MPNAPLLRSKAKSKRISSSTKKKTAPLLRSKAKTKRITKK